MEIAGIFKDKFNNKRLDNRRFNDIVSENATNILKELSGHGIKESKIMVDNMIVFTNCSGGTGASTVASNIAYVLGSQKFKMSVLVVDLNIVCPIQHIYFDKSETEDGGIVSAITGKSGTKDLVDFLTGQCNMGDATITDGNISIMYSVNRTIADEINCEDDMAIANFKELLNKARDLYDVVIIDCPMRISNALCNIALYSADKIYTVWDEGISSILNTDRVMRQLGFTGVDSFAKMMVVMNKKTSVKYSKFPFDKLGIPLVETLPFSTDVIYSSLDASVYCASGKARNKNGGEFERSILALAKKIVLIGGKTLLNEIDDDGYKIEGETEDTAEYVEDNSEHKQNKVDTEQKENITEKADE